ncbi:hypothetical protein L195_g043136 [Trifolium pratense]|uniref:Uncharacterized protein n=1 Tax=Trifolium pratense TaxID=57577 RepID=A0A2K3M8D5_TRIPR|nr:hypothetical protein L195_g043136 [Trifolium pratense]
MPFVLSSSQQYSLVNQLSYLKKLVFNPLVSLTLFVDGSLGDSDFNFGESGGVDEVLLGGSGGDDGSGEVSLPLILATGDVAVVVISMPTVTLVLELHIFEREDSGLRGEVIMEE